MKELMMRVRTHQWSQFNEETEELSRKFLLILLLFVQTQLCIPLVSSFHMKQSLSLSIFCQLKVPKVLHNKGNTREVRLHI